MKPENHSQNHESKRNVLVITGDPSLYDFAADQLGESCTILKAADSSEGLRILLETYHKTAAVIFDQQMPVLDGAAFLTQLHKYPHVTSVPVIVVSDSCDGDEECALLNQGADDYIPKPLRPCVFAARVRKLVRMQQAAAELDLMEKDDLTGVYSRQAFLHRAQKLLDSDPHGDYDLAITDIDKFKLINAICGEEKANKLLISLAHFLRSRFPDAIGARFGSDRFIWIQKSRPDSGAVIEKVLSDFAVLSPVPDVTVRCGIYAHVDRKLPVLRMADNALFALKSIKSGFGKTVACYDGPVSQQHYREQLYAARFPEALKNKEFSVWYQPKYDPYITKVVSAEALVRWKNSDGSFNLPGEFLSIFESNGMIGQLDEYVFRSVCRQQKKWKDAGRQLFPVSVNLSRNSMHKRDLAAVYSGIAREYGIEPHYLPIEITETTATDSASIRTRVQQLRQAGFPLHMDDFGSEHSSLQTLNVLDFDTVKLDKGLVDFIGDAVGSKILMYTMALAGELGLHTVAEGVETRQQLDFLMENGCDQIQGYYFSPPLPLEEFERQIADDLLAPSQSDLPAKGNLYILSTASHFEKLMTQRMLPRIPGGFLIYEEGGDERIIYSNEYLWKLFGCTDEAEFMDHVHSSFKGIVCPEELDRVEESIVHQIRGSTDDMDYVEYHIIRRDGTRVPVVDYGHLERMEKTNLFYVFIYRMGR